MHNTMEKGCAALIVAPPGRLRDGLEAMVRAVPQIERTLRADDGPSTLRMIAECPPALVLLDRVVPGERTWALLGRIKARWPQTACIVLVHTRQQRQTASEQGADAVLLEGFTLTTLAEITAKLLQKAPKVESPADGRPAELPAIA
jgi:DNA-binding NarL/FixJ family response regulator